MQTLRRFLVVAALMFWQGGFTFYAGVVVPVSVHRLPQSMRTLVTREVTNWLNVAGIVALLLLAWDAIVCRELVGWRKRVRWLAWFGMVLGLILLAWLHVRLDSMLNVQTGEIEDYTGMRFTHSCYLWVSTIQWALAVVWIWLTLRAWREADRSAPAGAEEV